VNSLAQCETVAVVGMGKTGYSVIRYLLSKGKDIRAMDQQNNPSGLVQIQELLPTDRLCLGALNETWLCAADLVIVSPGVDVSLPIFQRVRDSGKRICGDVELFCQVNQVPLIAITGSNGKTTLTTLVASALTKAGKKVVAAGNIGLPVLDTLAQVDLDYIVLELSSFQLESVYSLRAAVAVVLNVSPDHLDRHRTMADYFNAKMRIYKNTTHAVYNHELLPEERERGRACCTFGNSADADFYIANNILMYDGQGMGFSTDSWALHGQHHYQNALALIAIIHALAVPVLYADQVLKSFHGIAHRCQKIAEFAGVAWYNDSKATNEGAAIAAVNTLAERTSGRIILLVGGESKGASFCELKRVVAEKVDFVIAFGNSGGELYDLLASVTSASLVDSLSAAVSLADALAKAGDVVLLSPACASFDMFNNYKHRGEVFTRHVQEVSG
jgi:UDP-N-acetylmuramoylalanine--D-glutamate ligase